MVDQLHFTDVFVRVVLDHKAHHAIAPPAWARFSEKPILHSDQLDGFTASQIRENARDGSQVSAFHHASDNVKDPIAVAGVRGVPH